MKLNYLSALLLIFTSCADENGTKSEIAPNAAIGSTTWIIENRSIPSPEGVSEIIFNSIESTPQPNPDVMLAIPTNINEWKTLQQKIDSVSEQRALGLVNALSVQIEEIEMNGVTVRIIHPEEIDIEFSKAIFVHVHGGAYVFNNSTAGTAEAIILANQLKIPVFTVDYRMPPDHPFPAAQNDVVAAYQQILKDYPNHSLFMGGTSAGGGLVMSTILKLKDENYKLPVAIFAGTPWADLTKTGDSYYINDGIDRNLVTYEGILEESAKLYANGRDLKDPYLSPIYGDLSGFPPTFLLSGTRDLFLSNTVRAHRKLRDSGSKAELVVLEGQSHGDYIAMLNAPESMAAFKDLAKFLKTVLKEVNN